MGAFGALSFEPDKLRGDLLGLLRKRGWDRQGQAELMKMVRDVLGMRGNDGRTEHKSVDADDGWQMATKQEPAREGPSGHP